MIKYHLKSKFYQKKNFLFLYQIKFRARKINNSYKSEGQLPQDPDIQDLKLYVGK